MNKRTLLLLFTGLLFLAAVLRIFHLVDFLEWPDEIYTVWQAQLNLHDGFIHLDPDWPPLFGALVWGWMHLVGTRLEASRYLSVLIALVTVSLVYRAGRAFSLYTGTSRARSDRVGLTAGLVFAVMAYNIFSGVDVRGYGLLLLCSALSFWMTLRWLQCPSWRNAAAVCISIALLLYTGFESLLFVAYLTAFVALLRPRRFIRWIAIGAGTLILVLPIVPQFIQNNVAGRLNTERLAPPPLLDALVSLFRDFGGSNWFVMILAVAGVLVIWQIVRAPKKCRPTLLFAAWTLSPIVMYFVVHDNSFWQPRYLWWTATGLALFIGYATVQLPRTAWIAAIGVLLIVPAFPTDFTVYQLPITTSPPFREVFSWLARNIHPDDVLVIDPRCTCGRSNGWDYFVPRYFPDGLPIVDRPGMAPRVWYLSTSGWPHDDTLFAQVKGGRKPSIFVGPWYFLLQLYEGPPLRQGVSFGGKVSLNGASIQKADNIVSEDDSFQVKLWWSAEAPLTRDYSMSLALVTERGKLIAQADGPVHGPDPAQQTSRWQPGVYYDELRTLKIPSGTPPGTYPLVVTVYQWWDGVRLIPQSNAQWTRFGTDQSYLEVGTISVPGP